jgi:hypothetical protein
MFLMRAGLELEMDVAVMKFPSVVSASHPLYIVTKLYHALVHCQNFTLQHFYGALPWNTASLMYCQALALEQILVYCSVSLCPVHY